MRKNVPFNRYISQCCPDCKTVVHEPALCLLCGRLCSSIWKPCCRLMINITCCLFYALISAFIIDSLVFLLLSFITKSKVPISLFFMIFVTRESGCKSHAKSCGAGIGVFLLIKVSIS